MKLNSLSTMGSIWDGIVGIFMDIVNIIPKVVYLLFASITCCVDSMQCLIRKLAGLDVYYMKGTAGTEAVAQRDPLTQFIYGILGIGENSQVYKALNTVFWSLAIFGLIILAVTSIIAIIKSHYNEDTAQTSPWKYIYQAIKAVLTFAIIPFATIFGMQLASFALNTLDKIIAGSGQEGTMVSMYGSEPAELFVADYLEGNENLSSYIHYDLFGWRKTSTSTTFSGMLFKASAYQANRARTGSCSLEQLQNIKVNGVSIFGHESCSDFSNLTSEADRLEYVGSQIDYAFSNCLVLRQGISYDELKSATGVDVRIDLFSPGNFDSFGKFAVGAVWQFYDLWHFNFIVAFAGAFSAFAILISIILGMMSRLIKGAALFLVYPPILGLAPLDNFKAFKDWGKTFMQQILMALGSIVGINLLLLLLPYVQTITFFNIPVIDYIINVVILITGLIMAKDFIQMVSGWVGGADANSVGGGMKSEVSANIKKGASITAKAGIGTARVLGAVTSKPIKWGKNAIKRGTAGIRANRKERVGEKLDSKLAGAEDTVKSAESGRINAINSFINQEANGVNKKEMKKQQDELKAVGQEAYNKYLEDNKDNKDLTENEKRANATKARYAAMAAKIKENGYNKYSNGEIIKDAEEKIVEAQKDHDKIAQKVAKNNAKKDAIVEKYGLERDDSGNFKGKGVIKAGTESVKDSAVNFGKHLSGAAKAFGKGIEKSIDGASIGKSLADSFMKSTSDMASGMGFDKVINGAKDIFKTSLTFKGAAFDAKPELSGDKLARKTAEKQESASKKTNELLEKMLEEQKATKDKTAKLEEAVKDSAKKSSEKKDS